VDGVSQGDLSLDPRAELAPGKTLGGLRCTVVEYPHHNNGVGMNVQSQFDGLIRFIRGLLRANFRVI